MASSFFALFDDIATLLDDIAAMPKVAGGKTAGVLGDDLALNAQQVTGVQSNRELPVVLAVAKGSLINKSILVPLALAISAFASWAITPLLMVGGAYLCFEGAEKLAHKFFHSPSQGNAGPPQVSLTPTGGGSASRPWGRSIVRRQFVPKAGRTSRGFLRALPLQSKHLTHQVRNLLLLPGHQGVEGVEQVFRKPELLL